MKTIVTLGLGSCMVLITTIDVGADVTAHALGTDAPPAAIGGTTFTAFPADTQPIFVPVSSVALDGSSPPSGPVVGFSSPMIHFRIGQGWATWSHGYTGDVYQNDGSGGQFSSTLLMPVGAIGFRLYLENGVSGEVPFTVSATTIGGSTISLTEQVGSVIAAEGFAFLSDADDTLASITVTGFVNFAVGEFGIAMIADEPADFDGDGDVDGFDLALLLGEWTGGSTYSPCPPHTPADLNADCKVNGFDVGILLAAWG